jgi:hypothetical protein
MAGFQVLIAGLRRAEQQLEKQLGSVRAAISSLQLGGAVSARRGRPPGTGKRGPGRPKGSGKKKRKPMSAEAKAKIAAAQKARWAKQKAGDKKK